MSRDTLQHSDRIGSNFVARCCATPRDTKIAVCELKTFMYPNVCPKYLGFQSFLEVCGKWAREQWHNCRHHQILRRGAIAVQKFASQRIKIKWAWFFVVAPILLAFQQIWLPADPATWSVINQSINPFIHWRLNLLRTQWHTRNDTSTYFDFCCLRIPKSICLILKCTTPVTNELLT
jgi:hypothetical protein